jgi:hypothetical protein
MFTRKFTQVARNSQGRWTLEVEMDTPRQANVRMMRLRRQEQMRDSGRPKSAPGSSCGAPTSGLKGAAQNATDQVSSK